MRVVVGITGASGSIYACALLSMLKQLNIDVDIVASPMGHNVLMYECGITYDELSFFGNIHDNNDLFSPLASGSNRFDAMVIVPCSANTMAAIANGLGESLLLRVAAVSLKERRNLVIVPRETPLSLIQAENMVTVIRAGALVMPASPGFYSRPSEIWELVESLAARILDNLKIEHVYGKKWREADNNGK